MRPETRYTKVRAINIAYQIFGEGEQDLVLIPGWVSNIDLFWDEPVVVRLFEKLAPFCRVLLFDKRGTGLPDPIDGVATLEQRMEDVRAVMDAAGSDRATLFGYSEGGPVSALFAATYPGRTRALVLCGSYACRRADAGYDIGLSEAEMQALLDAIDSGWGRRSTSRSGSRAWRRTSASGPGGQGFCAAAPRFGTHGGLGHSAWTLSRMPDDLS